MKFRCPACPREIDVMDFPASDVSMTFLQYWIDEHNHPQPEEWNAFYSELEKDVCYVGA